MKKQRTTLIFLSVFLFISITNSFSEPANEDVKEKLPRLLGSGAAGTEFWFTIPPCFEDESTGYSNFIKIFVTSPIKTLVTVEVPGKGYVRQRETIPNDVIEFNITPAVGQPYTKGGRDDEIPEQVFKEAGIHVYADYPLVVYCVIRYNWTSDGFQCYPVSSLGREYIVAGHPVDAMFVAIWNYKLPNTTGIVAAYDKTKVIFTLGGNTMTKTAGGMRPGQTKSVDLDRGDVWMFSTQGSEGELSGSKVIASKPVAVVTGNMCANIPTGNQWCDYIAEMDIPTNYWGTDLLVGKIPKRVKSSIIKVFAKEPNTRWYRDGNEMGMLPDGGGIEGRGYQTLRMTQDIKPGSVVISGNKPLNVVLYNTGTQEDGDPPPNSDPFSMSILPVQQYLTDIVFGTPGIIGGQGFSENYINLVYETDANGNIPDNMEFGKFASGNWSWSKIKDFAVTTTDELFKKDVYGKKYALKLMKLPGDGVYRIKSVKPFSAYSFGFSEYDSYGYPASSAYIDLEKPDTLPPVPSWTMNCDGSVSNGLINDMPEDAAVRSNLGMIFLNPDLSYNYNFNYQAFVPGETRSTGWTLNVIDNNWDAKAVITFSDRCGNDTTITIEYFAPNIKIKPIFADFGILNSGESKSLDFWVVNESSKNPVTIASLKLQNSSEFKINMGSVSLPKKLAPLDSFKFSVTFLTGNSGTYSDSIGIGDTCAFSYKSIVVAKAESPVIIVGYVAFGKVAVGKPTTANFSIENSGKVDLKITGYTGPSNLAFSHNLPNVSTSYPLVIKPGDAQTYTIQFNPSNSGDYNDEIVFESNAGTIVDNKCEISGTGTSSGFTVNGYNWGSKRIHNIHPPDNNVKVISINNTGSQSLNIQNVQILELMGEQAFKMKDGNGNIIDMDLNKFIDLNIPANSTVDIPVFFNPTYPGCSKVVLGFYTTSTSDTATLEGIGVRPFIKTADYDFDSSIVNTSEPPPINRKKIRFECPVEYVNNVLVSDSVTITGFVINPAGGISRDSINFGSEGFRLLRSTPAFPAKLMPGQFLEIEADFSARKIGPHFASITSVSDAEAEVTSNWTGFGVLPLFEVAGGSFRACVDCPKEISIPITNTGNIKITIDSVRIIKEGNNIAMHSLPYFYPKRQSDSLRINGFSINTRETKVIDFVFSPTFGNLKETDTIRVWANIPVNSVKDGFIGLESYQKEMSFKFEIGETGGIKKSPGDEFIIPVRLIDVKGDINLSINAELSFNSTMLYPVEPTVSATRLNENNTKRIIPLKMNIENNVLKMDVQPKVVATLGNATETDLVLKILSPDLNPNEFSGKFTLEGLCDEAGKRLIGPSKGMKLSVHPNPAATLCEIKYIIPEIVYVELFIADNEGKVIKIFTEGIAVKSDNSIKADLTALPNGTYSIILVNGNNRVSTKLDIIK